jgi:hypothetical protein
MPLPRELNSATSDPKRVIPETAKPQKRRQKRKIKYLNGFLNYYQEEYK